MCWNYNGNKKKKGDVIVGEVTIAKGLDEKQFAKFIERKKNEAYKKGITLDEYLIELAKSSIKTLKYNKRYVGRKLKDLVDESKALRIYGKKGSQTVINVNNEVKRLISGVSKTRRDKLVMISGMTYQSGNKISKTFVSPNFLKSEIGKLSDSSKFIDEFGRPSVFQQFLDDLHPVLKDRYNLHLNEIKKGLSASSNDIARAGVPGVHGEIRALDKLLKSVDPAGKLGDDVFKDIIGYNRFLRFGANKIQPPCAHCHYLTDLITFIGL